MLLGARTHEVVDVAVLEGDKNGHHHVRHDMLAKVSARIGEPVREFIGLRQQHQAGIVVDERRDDNEIGLDRVVGSIGTVIRNARHLAAVVAVDAVTHGAGDQLEVSGLIGFRQLGDEDRGLCPNVAAERLAEAAIGTTRPILIGLRYDRLRRRERVIAELLGTGFKQTIPTDRRISGGNGYSRLRAPSNTLPPSIFLPGRLPALPDTPSSYSALS